MRISGGVLLDTQKGAWQVMSTRWGLFEGSATSQRLRRLKRCQKSPLNILQM